MTGCFQVLIGEKLEGLHLENLQLRLPLPPARVGAVPAPGLRTRCGLLLLLGVSLPSRLSVPTSLQPPSAWAVGDNCSCSCLPSGSHWLEAWSSLASLLTSEPQFSSRDKSTALALSSHLGQPHWAGYLPGEVSAGEVATGPPQRPHVPLGYWRTQGKPDGDPTCGQHFNLLQNCHCVALMTP